jgi:hypothetical protein
VRQGSGTDPETVQHMPRRVADETKACTLVLAANHSLQARLWEG